VTLRQATPCIDCTSPHQSPALYHPAEGTTASRLLLPALVTFKGRLTLLPSEGRLSVPSCTFFPGHCSCLLRLARCPCQ